MQLRDWFRPPRHILVIFLGVALVSGAALGLLGWLLLQQDNAVEAERRRERLDDTADRAVSVMQRRISDLESLLEARAGDPPAGVTIIFGGSKAISTRPQRGLLYYPEPPLLPEAPTGTFSNAEHLEFAAHDPAAAEQMYQRLRAAEPAVRAGALTRLARIYRKQNDEAAAQAAYDRLAQIPHVAVSGTPAGVIAREGLASLFQETHRTTDLLREATAFQADLQGGRWHLTRHQYEFYLSESASWIGKPAPTDEDAVTRADAFYWLADHAAGETRLIRVGSSPALVIARPAASEIRAAIAGPRYLASLCHEAVPVAGFECALADLEGRTVLGHSPPARDVAIRAASATHLPWTLHLFSPGGGRSNPPRRQLLLWVFAVLAIVLSTGAYFIVHAIAREMRVAQLQSDFVAAVSHEFRTPLSTLSQISEMLAHDRFGSEEQRRRSYDVLSRETERLRRLVEGLLDFGRFDAGAAAFRFEDIEAGGFVRGIVDEFQERVASQGFSIELAAPTGELHTSADREALGRAVWNLLDNAVKYSPECRIVWVDVEREGDCISIAVRDHGLGIPAHEQREIFNKFVRGKDSKSRHIKGTGIGLAMVRHIVRAHGGEILLASEPGQGSRFTMLLRAVGGLS